MRNQIILSLITLCSMVFIGCEQVIPIEYDYEPKMAVAFSLEEQSDTSTIYLSESRTVLSNYGIKAVREAEIAVKHNGQKIGNASFYDFQGLTTNDQEQDTLTVFKFNHTSTILPGDKISLEIKHPSLETVSSSATVPNTIENISVEYIGMDSVDTEWGYEEVWYKFEIEFDDPGGDNYYGLLVEDDYGYKTANRSILENQQTEVVEGAEASFYGSNLYFSNQFFKGKRVKILLSVDYFYNNEIPFKSLISVSNEEFESRLAANKQEHTYSDFFSEPIIIPTNIENGLGYFGFMYRYELD